MPDRPGRWRAVLRASFRNKALRIAALPALAAALWAARGFAARAHDPLPGFPRAMIWAWENPQKLEFLDPSQVGVAFLAETISLAGGSLHPRPRMQPLRVPPGTALMAVVRLERQREAGAFPPVPAAASEIARAASLPGVRALQVDFDARRSERGFYRQVLESLRAKLPKDMPLEITALESWCDGDPWIRDLPVNDAVPMLFRMGVESYRPGADFRVNLCRSSLGVSTDEPIARLPRGRRWFIFHPGSWTAAAMNDSLGEAHRWE